MATIIKFNVQTGLIINPEQQAFVSDVGDITRWLLHFGEIRKCLFKCTRIDLGEGLLKTSSAPEVVAKIWNMVIEDCRLTKRELVLALDISLHIVSKRFIKKK